MTRSSDDEWRVWECRLSCWRCLRCSLSEVFSDVLRLGMLSSERGLSDPFWLKGELLLFCKRRFNKRVALAGSWDLEEEKKCLNWIYFRNYRRFRFVKIIVTAAQAKIIEKSFTYCREKKKIDKFEFRRRHKNTNTSKYEPLLAVMKLLKALNHFVNQKMNNYFGWSDLAMSAGEIFGNGH